MSVKIALTTLLPVLSLLGLSTLSSHAETVAGYRFENYPAPLYIGKPAKLNYTIKATQLQSYSKLGLLKPINKVR